MAKTQLLQGTLDLLILRVLALGPLHGLGIAGRIAQVTRDALQIKAGSLFPALYRLEADGLVSGAWGESRTGRRAKLYTLTKEGRRQLADGKNHGPERRSPCNRCWRCRTRRCRSFLEDVFGFGRYAAMIARMRIFTASCPIGSTNLRRVTKPKATPLRRRGGAR